MILQIYTHTHTHTHTHTYIHIYIYTYIYIYLVLDIRPILQGADVRRARVDTDAQECKFLGEKRAQVSREGSAGVLLTCFYNLFSNTLYKKRAQVSREGSAGTYEEEDTCHMRPPHITCILLISHVSS
jgi:hypothetical protein